MKQLISIVLTLLICSQTIAGDAKLKSLHSDSIDVLHYTIRLEITDLSSKQIAGNTELQIVPKIDNLNTIPLDLLALTIDSIWIDSILVDSASYTYNDTLINISTFSPLSQTDTVKVTVFYHGQPVMDPSGWGGFYFNLAYDIAFNLGVAFEDNPHNYGRVWFPCVDDFVDRATYDFFITVNNNYKVICGGSLISVTDNGDSTSTYHWNLRDNIPAYLASVAVGDYIAVTDTFNGILGDIPVYIYVKSSDSLKAVNSFVNLKATFEAYETCFGPYMWERVGFIATTVGAMEHATNIAITHGCINGTLSYEWLFAHELSHHWFGDLITCHSAEDMWLNEGWAVFCESVFMEHIYGNTAYKDYVRANHKEVLRYLHFEDNGYRAVYGIPHEYTYSSTVYDKGADVVHSLRGYLGDSIFFDAVKSYLTAFAFKDVSSWELRDFLTSNTGIALTDFFDFWVFSPGFTHFSVDSFKVVDNSPDYDVTVYVRQRLKGTTNLANSNKIELTFMAPNWNTYTDVFFFSGELGNATFTIPFNPDIVMIDKEEKISDATTDNYKVINTIGNYDFDATYFEAQVLEISDSAFLRVEHNWVPPDNFKTPVPGLIISDYRYWKIDGILPAPFIANGYFYYNKVAECLDNTFITNPATNAEDSLVLLYRKSPAEDWAETSFTLSLIANRFFGELIADTLKLGEYAMAIWDWEKYDTLNLEINKPLFNNHDTSLLKIYPNPSENNFLIEFNITNNGNIRIFNISGKEVYRENIFSHQKFIKWNPHNLSKGTYIIELIENNIKLAEKKVIYN